MVRLKPFNANTVLTHIVLSIAVFQICAMRHLSASATDDKNSSPNTSENSLCYVSEYESNEKRSCKFPFSFKDKLTGDTKTFDGCTTYR